DVNWPLPFYRYGNAEFSLGIPHTGIDIVAPAGTEILATGPGTVVWAGFGLFNGFEDPDDPYGNAVAIQHDFGYKGDPLFTVYAHMSEALVARGQRVQLGDIVGLVGETGQTTGPHLHYEVRLGGNTYFHSVNPELWMSPPQGWGVLVGRVMSTGSALLESHEVRITSLETNRRWYVKTYGTTDVINRDRNYQENFVLSGLPAGTYEIFIPYLGYEHRYGVRIYPGAVTFFTYRGFNGFSTSKPLGILPSSMPR
ncbi:MAG: M23 family metallopeptidase, partial [Chloroflexi bacterium]|nr:M23 family metallopeptidase [Chloroflexota bacterium]